MDRHRADVEGVELRLVQPQVALQSVLALVLVDQLAEVGPEVELVALEVALVHLEACFDPVEEGSL